MKKNGEAFLRALKKRTYFIDISLTNKYLALINHSMLDYITKAMNKDFLVPTVYFGSSGREKKTYFATRETTGLTSLFQRGNPWIKAKERGNSKFFSITISC